jgi:hypothetical protein
VRAARPGRGRLGLRHALARRRRSDCDEATPQTSRTQARSCSDLPIDDRDVRVLVRHQGDGGGEGQDHPELPVREEAVVAEGVDDVDDELEPEHLELEMLTNWGLINRKIHGHRLQVPHQSTVIWHLATQRLRGCLPLHGGRWEGGGTSTNHHHAGERMVPKSTSKGVPTCGGARPSFHSTPTLFVRDIA